MQAVRNGAAPYLSAEDRLALGVTRAGAGGGAGSPRAHAAGLKFQAYEKAAPPAPKPIAAVDPFAGTGTMFALLVLQR